MNFKDKMNNMQSDYDPQAWNAMEEILDNEKVVFDYWKTSLFLLTVVLFIGIAVWRFSKGTEGNNSFMLDVHDSEKVENIVVSNFDSIQNNKDKEFGSTEKYEESGSIELMSEITLSNLEKDNNTNKLDYNFHDTNQLNFNERAKENQIYQDRQDYFVKDLEQDKTSPVAEKYVSLGNRTFDKNASEIIDYDLNNSSSKASSLSSNKTIDVRINEERTNYRDYFSGIKGMYLTNLIYPIDWSLEDLEVRKIKRKKTKVYPYNSVYIGGGIAYDTRFYNGYNLDLGLSRVYNKFFLMNFHVNYSNLEDRRLYAIKNEERNYEQVGSIHAQIGLVPFQYKGTSARLYLGGAYYGGIFGLRSDGITIPVEQIVTLEGVVSQLKWTISASVYQRITKSTHAELHFATNAYSIYTFRLHKRF